MNQFEMIDLMKSKIKPAVGCTEPGAVAYAVALAKKHLGTEPEKITVHASQNILKNAMGVGIPGTGMYGLPIGIALGVVYGNADKGLTVLDSVNQGAVAAAQRLLNTNRITIGCSDSDEKLYIEVVLEAKGHYSRVVIEKSHTNVKLLEKDGETLISGNDLEEKAEDVSLAAALTLEEIDSFVRTVDGKQLAFLHECVDINTRIAEEGIKNDYGLSLGKSMLLNGRGAKGISDEQYAVAYACAAADARMGGCTLPVMSSCGSGNQGLTATLPVIAVCRRRNYTQEQLYRALAYSILVTIHVKEHIGQLSALCACSVGASIGTAAALTYLNGGNLMKISAAIENVIADVSGVICDGAKSSCSMKIATGVSSAFRGALIAGRGHQVDIKDGIIGCDAEQSIDNLGILCHKGMNSTDDVIMEILVNK